MMKDVTVEKCLQSSFLACNPPITAQKKGRAIREDDAACLSTDAVEA
jgi:hypothetical protein